jgi:hypothetical protein
MRRYVGVTRAAYRRPSLRTVTDPSRSSQSACASHAARYRGAVRGDGSASAVPWTIRVRQAIRSRERSGVSVDGAARVSLA